MTLAIVFPGQGSQSVGMLSALAASRAVVRETFAEASEILGEDLWAMAQDGPESRLADTRNTQPLVFVGDIAVWRVLQAEGVRADVLAGHSLGEFAALVAGGAIDFGTGLRLVRRRAELMAEAVPDGEGGMAALIGLDDAAAVAVCRSVSGERIVEAVNFNAPGQVVISGHVDALERAMAAAREAGARRAVMLPVSVPNHSALMQPAGKALASDIDAIEWRMPEVPLLQNAFAEAPASLEQMLERLRAHMDSPVHWTRSIEAMRDRHGVDRVIECGPGKVLSGLGRRIDRALPHLAVEDESGVESARKAAQ